MRVEQIGDCTLYLGDCREILPTLGKLDAKINNIKHMRRDADDQAQSA